ncbi:hypothetical protein P8918_13270 [Bacillus spizizenii]|nr:hypothetical protein [Bacillus spizizenii]MCY8890538.1 hypothetical protein [Bacillus spizizenii]MEC0841997.1 hypothetical protein [Bacillus spizizenii]
MNLVYRYLVNRTKEAYYRGAQYLLLKNCDLDPVHLPHAVIESGEHFAMDERLAYQILDSILYNKRIVIVKAIE